MAMIYTETVPIREADPPVGVIDLFIVVSLSWVGRLAGVKYGSACFLWGGRVFDWRGTVGGLFSCSFYVFSTCFPAFERVFVAGSGGVLIFDGCAVLSRNVLRAVLVRVDHGMVNGLLRFFAYVSRYCACADFLSSESIITTVARHRNLFGIRTRVVDRYVGSLSLVNSAHHGVDGNEIPSTKNTIFRHERRRHFLLCNTREDSLRSHLVTRAVRVDGGGTTVCSRSLTRSFVGLVNVVVGNGATLTCRSNEVIISVDDLSSLLRIEEGGNILTRRHVLRGTTNAVNYSMAVSRVLCLARIVSSLLKTSHEGVRLCPVLLDLFRDVRDALQGPIELRARRHTISIRGRYFCLLVRGCVLFLVVWARFLFVWVPYRVCPFLARMPCCV